MLDTPRDGLLERLYCQVAMKKMGNILLRPGGIIFDYNKVREICRGTRNKRRRWRGHRERTRRRRGPRDGRRIRRGLKDTRK